MAMLLQAVELTDRRELTETRDGWRGRRVYKVNSGYADVALIGNAGGPPTGLPAKGDPWDAAYAPYLVCVSRKTERDGGNDTDPVNKTGGWTLVLCEYETLGLHGSLPPPSSDIAFTRLAPQVTSVQAVYGIDPNTGQVPAGARQIADGQGAPKDVGLLNYEVFKPLSPAAFNAYDIPRLVTLHNDQAVNSDAVSLPRYLSSTRQDSFSPGQLRFTGAALDDPDENGWRYLRVLLAAALDHKVYWTAQDQGGDAGGVESSAFLYRSRPFAGLW